MKNLHLLLCVAVAGVFFACERNTTYVQEVAGPTPCVACHDESNLITGKHTQWAESVHGTGEAYVRGTSASCAGCHSGNGFALRVAAGLDPNEVTAGDPDPTRQDCRACHKIHETYSEADFALRTTSPVNMYAITAGATFDGGTGNLCVNCHQGRRDTPVANDQGVVTGVGGHWGPHHGPQSAMILGLSGAGDVTGSPSGHYGVENTCVHCHVTRLAKNETTQQWDVVVDKNHTFEPNVSACQPCHEGATNFDIGNVQTDVMALTDQLGAELLRLGLINENGPDGHPIDPNGGSGSSWSVPVPQAYALWNWIYVAHEDKSKGVHNSEYTKALLEWSISAVENIPTPAAVARGQARVSGGSK